MSYNFHIPVVLNEVLRYLDPNSGQNFIDCTVGGGGHAIEILKRIEPRGRLLGIDADSSALQYTAKKLIKSRINYNFLSLQKLGNLEIEKLNVKRVVLVKDNFRNLKSIVKKLKFSPVNGILIDLGMSSYQIEQSGRGFSFQKDEPLDMRFSKFSIFPPIWPVRSSACPCKRGGWAGNFQFSNKSKVSNSKIWKPNLTAEEIINEWSEKELEKIFRQYGEEQESRRIARAICQARQKQKISKTSMLVQIITQTKTKIFFSKINPATKVFQALRIAVNDEINVLKEVLQQAVDILSPGGRLAIISFHSLEDRIVKKFFRQEARSCVCPPKSPICVCHHKSRLKILTKRPIIASDKEIVLNPRARSAKLRAAEKI